MPHSAGAKILLVEDEFMLRSVLAETLKDSGYCVLEAADGEAGLALLKQEPGIALLVSDVKMPKLSGYELTEAALALRPTLRVVLMTGYAASPPPDAIARARIPILHKPFDFDGFSSMVDGLVDAAESDDA